MTLQDMIDQFTIQWSYIIKYWNDTVEDCVTVARGNDFECDHYKKINRKLLNKPVTYMYVANGVLNIEIDMYN